MTHDPPKYPETGRASATASGFVAFVAKFLLATAKSFP